MVYSSITKYTPFNPGINRNPELIITNKCLFFNSRNVQNGIFRSGPTRKLPKASVEGDKE